MKETKSERFIRVAEARTNKIIALMELLGNCANRNNYEYTDQEVATIMKTLDTELAALKAKFDQQSGKKRERFTIKGD
ncbi:hypothetical protein [Bacillus sp. CBEL-1]|uniref:hypothetical protein n=1 Tax=Bacillaceae TaxID=186817 RepID=UPI00196B5752|nr:hypothetical protein [Bacillus sp. CBEL-1]USY53363.1 hypothetical protein NIZ91_11390 [Bacillus sp. 1780r2a1]